MLYKMIKSEISYYKTPLVSLLLFALIFIIMNLFLERFIDEVLRVFVFTLPVLGICMTRDERRGKKLRLYGLLPAPLWYQCFVRLAVWLPFWLLLFALLAASLWIPGVPSVGTEGRWLMIIVMNSVIVLALLVNILEDLRFSGYVRAGLQTPKIFIGIAVLTAALIYLAATFSGRFKDLLQMHVINATMASTVSALAVILFLVSIYTFLSRRSFVE
ncbi:hypothetical protein JXO59_09485 [candidate division KSB1 bacterium]|nr:hypothetical protein [candidate division KSB1 bacterium]